MLPNTPPMFEAHFGVPMTGAVLNTLNTRLDAEAIAFMLHHGEAKVLLTDREFARRGRALALLGPKPLVIDVAGRRGAPRHRNRPGHTRLRGPSWPKATPPSPGPARRRVGCDRAQLHQRHHRQPQGRGHPPPRRLPERGQQRHHLGLPQHRSTCGRCRCSTATAGASPGPWRPTRHQRLPAPGRPGADLPADPRAHGVTTCAARPSSTSMLINAPAALRAGHRAHGHGLIAGARRRRDDRRHASASGFDITHVYGLTEVYGPAAVCAKHGAGRATCRSTERAALNGRQGVRYPLQEGVTVLDPVTMQPVPPTARPWARSCSAATSS
jgi:fatty-acyl-CoA synthase